MSFLLVPVPRRDKLESTDCTSEASASAVADGLSERFPKLPYKEEKSQALNRTLPKNNLPVRKHLRHPLIGSFGISRDIKVLGSCWIQQGGTSSAALLTGLLTAQERLVWLFPDSSQLPTRYSSVLQIPKNPTTFPKAKPSVTRKRFVRQHRKVSKERSSLFNINTT